MLTIYCVGVPKSSFDTFLDLYECDRQDAHRTSQQKPPVTKERLEAIFARLDRLGLGENDEHTIDPQDSVRPADLFTLVIPTPCYSISLTPFSALNRIKDKLQMVSDRIQAADYAGDDKDFRIVSELMDDIRDTVTDYQVREDITPFLRPSHSGHRSRWRTSRPYTIRIFN